MEAEDRELLRELLAQQRVASVAVLVEDRPYVGLLPVAMKRPMIFLVSVVVLILSLLALDDITTGQELNFYLEWTMVTLGVPWFGGLALARARRWRRS